MRPRIDRRRLAALAAVIVASGASVASLDTAAPLVTYTGTLPEQSVSLTETSPASSVTVHVGSTEVVSEPVTLTIHLEASWKGFADAGDGGAADEPIVEATLDGHGTSPDSTITLDRAITSAPGKGKLILSADASCTPEATGCGADFTFTLARIEPAPSGPVVVKWTPTGAVASDNSTPVVGVTVIP